MLPYSSRMARTSCALSTVARIFALLRITRGSFSTAAISAGGIAATCAGSKPWNASRMPSHLTSTTRQLIPASKTERDRCSRKNAGSAGAWSRSFWNGAASSRARVRSADCSAAAVSPDFTRATSAVASSCVRTLSDSALSGSCSRLSSMPPRSTGSNPASRISWATTGLASWSPDRNMTHGGSRWLSSAMTPTESELKARTQRARGNASASDRSVTCCGPNESAASIMTRPSTGPAACSTSVTAGPGTATSTTSAPATASATEAACACSPSSAASARGRVACRAANVTSWPAACQSRPSVEPTRPAPRTAIFIPLLLRSEAISCGDDEFATGPVLLHVGVCLQDLVEPVHAADRDGGRAGGDGVQEVLQDPQREVGGVPLVRGQPHPRGQVVQRVEVTHDPLVRQHPAEAHHPVDGPEGGPVQVAAERDHLRGGDAGVVRVPAVEDPAHAPHQRGDLLPCPELPAGALFDDPGRLDARHPGEGDALRQAQPQVQFEAVEPERPDPDQHPAGGRYRDRELADGQGGRRSRGIQDDRAHGGRRPSGSGALNPTSTF